MLRFSKNSNESKEVAFVFNADLSNRRQYKGSEDKLNFDGGLSGNQLFVMHNHPRNNSFSDTDVALWLSNDCVKTLSIVKNSGSVETLTKTDKFRKSELILDFKRQYKKYVKTGADSEIDKAIEKFFQRNEEGLEWKTM